MHIILIVINIYIVELCVICLLINIGINIIYTLNICVIDKQVDLITITVNEVINVYDILASFNVPM